MTHALSSGSSVRGARPSTSGLSRVCHCVRRGVYAQSLSAKPRGHGPIPLALLFSLFFYLKLEMAASSSNHGLRLFSAALDDERDHTIIIVASLMWSQVGQVFEIKGIRKIVATTLEAKLLSNDQALTLSDYSHKDSKGHGLCVH